MDLRGWLRDWLGITDIGAKIRELDLRMASIESHVDSMFRHMGKYKSRTKEELTLMRAQIGTLLATVENIMDSLENEDGLNRARKLRARLRNNLTRIDNELAA